MKKNRSKKNFEISKIFFEIFKMKIFVEKNNSEKNIGHQGRCKILWRIHFSHFQNDSTTPKRVLQVLKSISHSEIAIQEF